MRARRRFWAGLQVALVAAATVFGSSPLGVSPASAATCNLVPQLRSITINQGVGSYAPLARGKETLVRLYLSLPSCAASASTIALTGGSLAVSTGGTALGTVAEPTPLPSVTTPPLMTPFASAPAVNSPADPKFVVPAGVLAPPNITTRFTATFLATVRWTAKDSARTTPVSGTTTFSTLTGSTAPLTAVVEQRSNALRILVVPMGDTTQSFISQFPTGATAAVENAMATVSRTWPVPAGVGDLSAGTGGVRYKINPALLDISAFIVTDPVSGGRGFCGTAANFNVIKGLLAQYLQSWNTANPAQTADIVLGAVSSTISLGSTGQSIACAEGMASVNSPQAWIRAIPDVSGQPSMSGALASMELAHTLGVVPTARDDPFSVYHSPNLKADLTAPNRGYNVPLRALIADNRTAMTLSGTWNNTTVNYEPGDFATLLCRLGGQPMQDCTASGTLGTATGVAAGPRLVMSGTTDLTPAGTSVVESYFASNVAPTAPDPTSPLKLRQVQGATVLSTIGIALSNVDSDHDSAESGHSHPTDRQVFSISFPFNTASTDVRLINAAGQILYSRARGTPVVQSTSTTPVGGEPVNLTNDPAFFDLDPTLSTDGVWAAWSAPCLKPPVTGCPAGQNPDRISVARVDDVAGLVEIPPIVAADPEYYEAPAFGPVDGTGRLPLAFTIGGDLYTVRFTPATKTFSTPVLVVAAESFIEDPTWSPDGLQLAYEDRNDIYIVDDSDSATPVQLTTTGDASQPSWSRTPGEGRIVYRRSNFSDVGFTGTVAVPPGHAEVAPSVPIGRAEAGPIGIESLEDIRTVNSDSDSTDGSCDTAPLGCTLREAIEFANANGGATIRFQIGGGGSVATIDTDGLPTITESVVIDGTTQIGEGSNPGVELVGPGGGTGLGLSGVPNSEIRGLIIHGFTTGIHLLNSGGNVVAGNWIGLNAEGDAAPGNEIGVTVEGTDSNANRVGGSTVADRNVISKAGSGSAGVYITGGAENTKVHGNYIGTDRTGLFSLSVGGQNGIELEGAGAGTGIGGTAAAERNVISGNGQGIAINATTDASTIQGNWIGLKADGSGAAGNSGNGIQVFPGSSSVSILDNVVSGNGLDGIVIHGTGNTVQGNLVGTNPAGTAAIGNTKMGISVFAGPNRIGGGAAGEGNLVSGNVQYGVQILGSGVTVQGNRIGTDAAGTGAIPSQKGLHTAGDGNVIGGSGSGEGNLISGNAQEGLVLQSNNNVVRGNRIGTNAAGTAAIGNETGILVLPGASGNVIGGPVPGEGNVVSGHSTAAGIEINSDDNFVRGNVIGTDVTGNVAIPNQDGLLVIGAGNVIGGTVPGSGNLISGNTNFGVNLSSSGTTDNQVVGNRIGTNRTGTAALGNNAGVGTQVGAGGNFIGSVSPGGGNVIAGNITGVLLQSGTGGDSVVGNTIGGSIGNIDGIRINSSPDINVGDGTLEGGNVIGGNSAAGIRIEQAASAGTTILGNRIGVAADGSALGNAVGVTIESLATGITVGDTTPVRGNRIGHNTGAGIQVSSGTGSSIRGNEIFANGGLGINLIGAAGVNPNDTGDGDSGPNGLQNYPQVTSVQTSAPGTITGTLDASPGGAYDIDVFSLGTCDLSGNGEGDVYLGSTTATANTPFAFDPPAPVTSGFVTMTATNQATGDTSEFSGCFDVAGATPADLELTVDGGPATVVSGEDLTQTITLKNLGGTTATNIVVSTHLDFGAYVASVSGESEPCDESEELGDVLCFVPDIAPGATGEITFIVRNAELGAYLHSYDVASATDANGDNNADSFAGTVISSCPGGGACLWTIDPAAADPTASRELLVDDANAPSWGSGGRIAFERFADEGTEIWSVNSLGLDPRLLTTGHFDAMPWLNDTRLAFARDLGDPFQYDIFLLDLGAPKQLVQFQVQAPANFDPNLLRADVLLDCGIAGGPIYLVAVALKPVSVLGSLADFETAFDPSLSCAGGTIRVVATAGIDRSVLGAPGSTTIVTSENKPPVAAVSGPPLGTSRLQFDIIPLRGLGKDAEEGELTGSRLTWSLIGPAGPVTLATSTGNAIDVPVPPGGWPAGQYTATLTAHDASTTGVATTTFTILADRDNDGIPAGLDVASCPAGASRDTDPSNAFGDLDSDGIPNQSDPQPCQAPDPNTFAYTATVNFDPNTLYIPSSGSTVTMYVSVQGRDMRNIAPSSVRLSRISGTDPTSTGAGACQVSSFAATSYSATGAQGVAKFDRQKLIRFLSCAGVMNRTIEIEIVGTSKNGVAPPWRFEGIGTTTIKPG